MDRWGASVCKYDVSGRGFNLMFEPSYILVPYPSVAPSLPNVHDYRWKDTEHAHLFPLTLRTSHSHRTLHTVSKRGNRFDYIHDGCEFDDRR